MTIQSTNNTILVNELNSCTFDLAINPSAIAFSVTSTDSTTVDFSGSGTSGSPLTASVKLSTDPTNLLQVGAGGLLVSSTAVAALDKFVRVSADDAVPNYLLDKLSAGTNITLSKITTVDGEKIVINASCGGGGSIVTNDSSTIDFSGNGQGGTPLAADVKVSTTPGNALTINATGLYVPQAVVQGESTLVASDSNTIDFTTSGTANHNLTASVKVSGQANNILETRADGLYVPVYTFNQEQLVANDSSTIDFTVSGVLNHTLTASVKLSSDSNNALESRANGLYVSNAGAQTPITAVSSSTILLEATGTNNHTITASLNVSAVAGNSVTIQDDGLYVSVSGVSTNTPNTLVQRDGTGSFSAATINATKLNVALASGDSVLGTLSGTGTSVGAQWKFVNDYNTTGCFVGVSADLLGNAVLAAGGGKSVQFNAGTTGNELVGRIDPSGNMFIVGTRFRIQNPSTVATASSTGTAGDIQWDSNFIYVCVGTNVWKRAALTSW